MRLRDATEADAALVARLHTESWRSAYNALLNPAYLAGPIEEDRLSLWVSRFAHKPPHLKVVIAETAAQPVAFVCAIGGDDARWGTLIDNLHVQPAAKGSGAGSVLLRAAADWSLAAYPEAGLYLWCFEQNEPARRFYERRGGTIVERARHELSGGDAQPALRFHWPDPAALLAEQESGAP